MAEEIIIANDEQLLKASRRTDTLRADRLQAILREDVGEVNRIDNELGKWLAAIRKYKYHQ